MAAPLLALETIAPERRLPAWKDAVCDTFVRLECETDHNELAHGRLEAGLLGPLHVARVASAPQTVTRTSELAKHSSEAFVLVSLQTRGRTVIEQSGRQAVLQPGMLGFYDTERPYRLRLPDAFDQIVLHVPRAHFASLPETWTDHTALAMGSANPYVAPLFALAPQLLALSETAAPTERERVAQIAADLMALALAHGQGSGLEVAEPNTSLSAHAVWNQAHRVMQQQLHNHALTADAIAAGCRVSVRRLQEVFQHRGATVSDTLWSMRLEQAHIQLQQSALRHQSITAIAMNAGFSDTAHFCRRFKQRFGVTPTALRKERLR
jgi:AraC-like DNA-binding protein